MTSASDDPFEDVGNGGSDGSSDANPEDGSALDAPRAPDASEHLPDDLGPEVPSPPEPEVDEEIQGEISGHFWRLVFVFNVALLALSVGGMLIAFRGNWTLGSRVLAVGVVASAYGILRYYRFEQYREEELDAADGKDSDAPDGEDSDGDA